jgi:protein-S-isoprenylcysteine O-methyltransferase Ste14
MSDQSLSRNQLIKMVAARLLIDIPVLIAFFFLPAGTFDYWQARVYIAVLLIPMLFVMRYLLKNDPALLERRMKSREKETEQKRIVALSSVLFVIAFLLPGFDRRFGWSHTPVWLIITADLLVLVGYAIFILVIRENSYASRVIEVTEGQKVISSGPYAWVRHPMYAGILLLYIFSPLALGSYWAVIPMIFNLPIFVARIWNEESVLTRELPGYTEYLQKVRYRLIPGIW